MHTRTRTHAHVAATLLILSCGAACSNSIGGSGGAIDFRLPIGEGASPDAPIALGASLVLNASEVGSGSALELVSVTSSDPAVLSVGAIEGSAVTVTGASEGSAELTFEATDRDGDPVTDTLTFEVALPAAISIASSCGVSEDDRGRLYLPSSTIQLEYDISTEDGSSLRGFGFNPIALDTLVGAEFDAITRRVFVDFVLLTASDTPGAVSFDLAAGANPLDLAVVDPATVDGARFVPLLPGTDVLPVDVLYLEASGPEPGGIEDTLRVTPTRGGEVVCGDAEVTEVTSLTPDVCSAALSSEDTQAEFERLVGVDGVFIDVRALTLGDCEVEVTFAGVDGAHRAVIPVEPAPDSP